MSFKYILYIESIYSTLLSLLCTGPSLSLGEITTSIVRSVQDILSTSRFVLGNSRNANSMPTSHIANREYSGRSTVLCTCAPSMGHASQVSDSRPCLPRIPLTSEDLSLKSDFYQDENFFSCHKLVVDNTFFPPLSWSIPLILLEYYGEFKVGLRHFSIFTVSVGNPLALRENVLSLILTSQM